jgi:hypothetical protein
VKKEFAPNTIAMMDTRYSKRERPVEIISRPVGDGTIMCRMVPGDPTTLATVRVESLRIPNIKYKYIHFAEVSGWGSFPEDMLRYDCACLYDHNQHEEPVDGEGHLTFVPNGPVRIYRLSTIKKTNWTHERWASFGWKLKEVLEETLFVR